MTASPTWRRKRISCFLWFLTLGSWGGISLSDFGDISLGCVTGNRRLNGGLPPSQPQRGDSGTLHGLTGNMKPWPRFGIMWLFKRLGVGKLEDDPHSGKGKTILGVRQDHYFRRWG